MRADDESSHGETSPMIQRRESSAFLSAPSSSSAGPSTAVTLSAPAAPPPPAAAKPAPPASNVAVIVAFFSLVLIQVLLSLSYKSSQTSDGKYPFSPASILVLAEFVKFTMAAAALYAMPGGAPPPHADVRARVAYVWAAFCDEAFVRCGGRLPLAAFGLALFYCTNNNLTFYIFRYADPANLNLVKSGATFVSAMIMRAFLDRPVSSVQWSSIAIQTAGLVVTQFGASCGTGSTVLSPLTYVALLVSLTLTSFSGVWNDKLMKDSAKESVSINSISILLYASGALLNTGVHVFSPSGGSGASFFRGFDRATTILCLLCNSLIGLAVTAVYKYADAVIKTMASAVSTGVLFFISAFFFGVPINVVVVAGTISIFIATHLYVTNPEPAKKPAASDAAPAHREKDEVVGAAATGGSSGGSASAAVSADGAFRRALAWVTARRDVIVVVVIIVLVLAVIVQPMLDGANAVIPAASDKAGAAGGARALGSVVVGGGGGVVNHVARALWGTRSACEVGAAGWAPERLGMPPCSSSW